MEKVLIAVLALAMSIACVEIARADVQYLGEVCLELTNTVTGGPQTLRLGILSYGADTFPIHGKILIPISGGFVSEPVHGTAVISGTTVQMTLNASVMDYGPLSATYSISLNLGTLAGNFGLTTVKASAVMQPTPSLTSSGGTVKLQACP